MTALLAVLVFTLPPQVEPAPQPRINVEARQAIPRVWITIADCESDRRWHINNGNGYSGGLQFVPSTWTAFAPDHFPPAAWQATPLQQVQVAERVLAVQGWGAWPSCARQAGLR